jgi:hypothetical protein
MVILLGSRFTEMRDLPEFFVRECLEIAVEHPRAEDPHFLLDCAANYMTNSKKK